MRKLDISVIGVPLDYGQSRRGVDMGPSAMRYAGVMKRLEAIGHNLKDEGDVPVSAVEQKDGEITNLKNLKEVVQATSELANRVAEVVREREFSARSWRRSQYSDRYNRRISPRNILI